MTTTAPERGVVERNGQRGVSRVLSKLENSIEAGNYYEAHQMYRTLYFRYTAQRKLDECLELLNSGTLKLLAKQQETSAADLGLLLVDTLEKRSNSNDAEVWMENLGVIIARLSSTTVERETLISRSIKWSGDISGNNLGHPTMHKLVAQVFWSEDNIEPARHHFLLCRDGNLCGQILTKISVSKGYSNEVDLFIVQAVLQQLCLKDLKTAADTFASYVKNHPQIEPKESPFGEPLLNFISLLFRCIDMGRLDSFQTLCDLYKPSLKRDPSYEKYLTKIGVLFFGAPPPPSVMGGGLMGGMFGDLFSRLFQGFEDEEDDNANGQQQSAGTVTNTNELD